MTVLVLASQSPRRTELLSQLGLPHEVVVADIDESQRRDESPADYVKRLAQEKAQTGLVKATKLRGAPVTQAASGLVVLGADTIVVLQAGDQTPAGAGDEILGKPRGPKDSAAMLRRLSGRQHLVMTGVAATDGVTMQAKVVQTKVHFRALGEPEIANYVTPSARVEYCREGR